MMTNAPAAIALVALLFLTACGGTPLPQDPGGPSQPTDPQCRETVTSDITVPVLLSNGPEECDYYFPGGDVATYRINSDLRIEAGTVLRFGINAILYVDKAGSITAVGEPSARIVFEGEKAVDGYWHGICFVENRESRLEYVDVRWAGKAWTTVGNSCRGAIAGAYPGGETVHIRNSTVAGSYVSGLSAHHLTLGQFANNAFFGNREYGVNVHAEQVSKLDRATDYLGSASGATNGKPFVYAGGYFSDPEVYHVWQNLNAPYFVSDQEPDYPHELVVYDRTGLIITAGTIMVFEGAAELYVYGGSALGLSGTPDNRVVLKGLSAERRSWGGVKIEDSAAILEYVDVLWGGRDDYFEGSLVFIEVSDDTTGKELRDVYIDGSKNCALMIWHDDISGFDPLNVRFGPNNEHDSCRR